LGAVDNGQCNNILEVRDTIYVRVIAPLTLPPVIGKDLSANQSVNGDTINIVIDSSACYTFFIADLTPETGLDFAYDFEDIFGNSLPITQFETVVRNDSVFGSICFLSSCANGGTLFRSVVTGFDLKECPPFESRSDTTYIRVITDFRSFAGRDTSFCAGSGGVELSVIPIGGEAPYYFTWRCDDPGNCGFTNANQNDSTPVVNPNQTTTYSVQVTDRNGCTSEIDDILVTVKALPVADAGPDVGFCEGEAGVRLSASVRNPQAAPAPYTYEWLPSAGLSNPAVNNPFASPIQTTIYTLVVGSANGCTSDATTLDTVSTVTVSVNPYPEVEAGPDQAICLGDTVELQGFASAAGPEYQYVWTPSRFMADSSAAVTAVSPRSRTTYYLVAWSNGCPSPADSVTIDVKTLPTLTLEGGGDVCAGDSLQLTARASGDPNPTSYAYRWTPGQSLNDSTLARPWASPLVTTTYRAVATSANGCDSEPSEVTVVVRPTPIADAGNDTTVCGDPTFQLNGTFQPLGGTLTSPVVYRWSPPGRVSASNIADPVAQLDRSRRFFFTVRSGACQSTDSIQINVVPGIEVFASADTNRICSGDTLELRAVGGRGNAQFSWAPSLSLLDSLGATVEAYPQSNTAYIVTAQEGICVAKDTLIIGVNPTPEVDYFLSQDEGCATLSIGLIENTQDAVSYVWDFGDGTPISNEASPSHTYFSPGRYPIRLTAIGVGGCSRSLTRDTVEVSEVGRASFVIPVPSEDGSIQPGDLISFQNLSQNAVSHFWSFGD
ncbi:MAG: PKD domain-containing protein, partial [Bacteroidota bacterium]